ncbi:hypothetical protein [Pseudanabaena sp. ABRG5-3]|nr:hypothetical protein [Pseudanabaena sp. ABRG5-3]
MLALFYRSRQSRSQNADPIHDPVTDPKSESFAQVNSGILLDKRYT